MFVSKLIVRSLLAELEARGVRAAEVVADPELFGDAQAWSCSALHGPEVDRLIARALRVSNDPGLGLTLGQQVPENALRVVGHLLLASGTLREAFAAFRKYSEILLGCFDWYLAEHDRLATFGFARPDAEADTRRFWAEWLLSLALRVGRRYAGDACAAPHELLLAHPAPSYAERYHQLFGCEVHFDQPAYGIVFHRSLLDRRQPHADEVLTAVLREAAEALHRQATGEGSFAERVRLALRYESDLVNLDFQGLAARWGVTRRTLRRRLSEEGVSLSELVEEACCRQAQELLRRPDESIKEIAAHLGYSEVSAFHRAFKRWTGLTPAAYRLRAWREASQASMPSKLAS
jgi:AraC-like DNA-binding protein